jgi:hypothetical protein
MSAPNSAVQSPEAPTRKRILERIFKKELTQVKNATLTPYFSQSPEMNPRKRHPQGEYELTQGFTDQNETFLQSYELNGQSDEQMERLMNINQRSLSPDTLRQELIASLHDRLAMDLKARQLSRSQTVDVIAKARRMIVHSQYSKALSLVQSVAEEVSLDQAEELEELKLYLKNKTQDLHSSEANERQLKVLISTFNPLYIKVGFTQQLKASTKKNTEIKELLHILYRLSRRVNSGKALPSHFPSTWKDVEAWLSQPGVVVTFLRQLPNYITTDKLSSSKC